MIPLIPLLVAFPLTAIVFILMFLPALIEVKRPQDAGPRLITTSFTKLRLHTLRTVLSDIEEELNFDSQLASKIAIFLAFIPNLET
jgi:hypothetical protein